MTKLMRNLAFLASAVLISFAVQAAEVDLGVVKNLIDTGKAAEAYALLEPFEFEMSGNQEFDYLLGTAALDSGKPDKAILAFDRVLSANPKFAGARLDMGRAYFALHDDEDARKEFETALAQEPPEAAKAVIQKYLAAIEERGKPKITTLTAYAEATVGHDSNVNASTNQGNVYIPVLGATLTLSSTNLKTSSSYLSAGSGAEVTRLIKPGLRLFAGADVRKRDNPDAANFNTGSIDAHAGLRFGEDASITTVALQHGRFYLGGRPNRDTTGVVGQWQYTINPQYQLGLFGVYNFIRYPDVALESEDINQGIVGANWLYAFDPDGRMVLSSTLFVGHEAQQNQRANGNKDFRGVRFGAQHGLRDGLDLYGNLGVQYGDYDTINVAFDKQRHDWQYDAGIGANWRVADNWSVRPQVTYTKNGSNISIYKYDRTDASVTVRWDFR